MLLKDMIQIVDPALNRRQADFGAIIVVEAVLHFIVRLPAKLLKI